MGDKIDVNNNDIVVVLVCDNDGNPKVDGTTVYINNPQAAEIAGTNVKDISGITTLNFSVRNVGGSNRTYARKSKHRSKSKKRRHK